MRSRSKKQSKSQNIGRLIRIATLDLASSMVVMAPMVAFAQEAPVEETAPAAKSDGGTDLSDITVTGDPMRLLGDETSASSVGFAKPLLETPRSVSFVSSEQLGLLGISSVDDLTRAVPGTFTTTRYGLQGGINVRGVSADMYYRGMKRINMQGHARTALAALDSIEVVKGPPSPIYGMGKIGGYSNLVPKSGRAQTGGYLTETTGFVQAIAGMYDRAEMSAGAGGPVSVLGKKGGYYVYGLMENSGTYTDKVGVQQKLLQGTISLDDFIGPFRLEAGGQYQNSITSGAYMNRVTQDLIDNGNYITGMPLAQLDSNHDGAIGFRETHLNSPIGVGTTVGANNRPLYQGFTWGRDANNNYLRPGEFPTVAGIPQSMRTFLEQSGRTDAITQLMLSQPTVDANGKPISGPLPTSGYLPVGMVLDPATAGVTKVNYHRNGSYERIQDAILGLGYADLVYDTDPDFTVRAQFFKDYLDSYKNSQLPYGEKQDIHVWEEKITVTKRIPDEVLPAWLRVNSLASVNYRQTKGWIKSSGGDYDYRQDVMYNNGDYEPNTLFWNQLDDDTYDTGAPKTNDRYSNFNEMGLGLMFDVDFFKNTNLLVGWRIDGSEAYGVDYRRFNENTSTATNAGYLNRSSAKSWDDGTSWSVSLSQQLPWGLRPYVTFANSSVTLDGANNIIQTSTIASTTGHIGEAELKEAGIKASLFKDVVTITSAVYEQTRTDISNGDDPTAGAEVSSTKTRGWETEIKWIPVRNAYISAYAIFQKAEYLFSTNTNVELTAKQLGFADVIDPATGEVIYPAEAFLYGGRSTISVPAAVMADYMDRTGNPEKQYGLNMSYTFDSGIGVLFGGNYFSQTYADRLKLTSIPSAVVANAALTYDVGKWHYKLNGYNIFDERYFRARNSDTGASLASVMAGERYEFTVKLDF